MGVPNNGGRVHWRAPTAMMAAFMTGALLAFGHHQFYHHLEGTEVPTDDYGVGSLHYSKQQMNVQIGTAFAFLVKAFLAIATSIAYTQIFWHGFINSSHTGRKAPTVNSVDDAFAARDNLVALLNPAAWLWNPILYIFALVIWLMPITSILTPGTISIEITVRNQSSLAPIPQLNFTTLDFTNTLLNYGSSQFFYNGPSQAIQAVAAAVSAGGAILPIRPPSVNSSWETEFHGPALKCFNLNEKSRKGVLEDWGRRFDYIEEFGDCANEPGTIYSSWFHTSPFDESGNAIPNTLVSEWDATFSIVTFPGMLYSFSPCQGDRVAGGLNGSAPSAYSDWRLDPGAQNPLGTIGEGASMVTCALYNTTYNVHYNYVNGAQTIAIDAPVRDSDKACRTSKLIFRCGDFFVFNQHDPCPSRFDPSFLRELAYQGIMDAFASRLTGTIVKPVPNFSGKGPTEGNVELGMVSNTSILSTSLVRTDELAYLNSQSPNYLLGISNGADLQTVLSASKVPVEGPPPTVMNISSIDTHRPIFGNMSVGRPLASTIEEMFRNYTVSLLSSPLLQHPSSSETAMKANITTMAPYNIYKYSAKRLWIAYGIAIALTAIAVLHGLILMFSSGASYSDSVSTIMRSAWIAELDIDRADHEQGFQDPLPKSLAVAKILLPSNIHTWAAKDERAPPVSYDDMSGMSKSGVPPRSSASLEHAPRGSAQVVEEDTPFVAYDDVSEISDLGRAPSVSTHSASRYENV
ncbi:hypothetical protein EJ04DRAFT_58628 [Polyplosphaeria fusca]|uniref:Uncharacterized protein n=1 Tax=Polyplosphaeria fusca TaxID=682080 RepID=A0A9P4QNQ1_9PLEO|nr:hypothetical protein EJ04DRAFT_58628 [Polyplosphaeria fusca]